MLAGCSEGDPVPRIAPSSPVSTSASLSESPSPSTGPVEPTMPAAAKRHTAAGAESFVRFWFDSFTYGMTTGDTALVGSLSAPDCQSCEALVHKVDDVYRDGGQVKSRGWRVEEATSPEGADAPTMLLRIHQAARVLLDEQGKVVDRTQAAKVPMRASLVRHGGTWYMQSLEIIG